MKKSQVKRIVAFASVMFITLLNASIIMAQPKVDDKEIVGAWVMSSMKYDGENKNYISESYNQVKVYRTSGEYACAEVIKGNDGNYEILPHEYGTYSLKNGEYIEVGRKLGKMDWVNKTSFKSRWKNRNDIWKKATNMPEKLIQHIVDKCKAAQPESKELQDLMKKHIFGK